MALCKFKESLRDFKIVCMTFKGKERRDGCSSSGGSSGTHRVRMVGVGGGREWW